MGKKLQGAALRAKRRAQVALEELQDRQAETHVQETYKAKDDAELFVLDTQGSSKQASRASAPTANKNSNKKRRMELSQKDKMQVDKLLKSHTPQELAKMAAKGKEDMELQQRLGPRRKRLAADTRSAGFDLWNNTDAADEAAEKMKKKELPTPGIGSTFAGLKPAHETTKAKKQPDLHKAPSVSVDVAKAGQSYRPDPVAHKNLMQTAAELEVGRERTLDELKRPLGQGMSAETRALLVEDSSDYDSDSDDEEGDPDINASMAVGPIPKREDKMTRAQRNKQKRLREEKTALELSKRQKVLEKQVGELPTYKKELKKKAQENAVAKPEQPVRPLGKDVEIAALQEDPNRAPTVPVAVQASTSLRRLQPKGSLVQERLASWQDRKLAHKPTHKQPHKKKRKLAVKGTRNNEANAGDVVLMG